MAKTTLSKTAHALLRNLLKTREGIEYGFDYRGRAISGTSTAQSLIAKGYAVGKRTWSNSGAYSTDRVYITPQGLKFLGVPTLEAELPVIVTPVVTPVEEQDDLVKARALLAQVIETFGVEHRITRAIEHEIETIIRIGKRSRQ